MPGTKLGLTIYCHSSCGRFNWLVFPLETNVLLQAQTWDASGHKHCQQLLLESNQYDEDTKNDVLFAAL